MLLNPQLSTGYGMPMLADHVTDHLKRIEQERSISTRSDAFELLRSIGLDDFGAVLWQMPIADFPRLSKHLPRMTPDEITRAWTGSSGLPLLSLSLDFVRSCADNFTAISGQTLRGKRILDFGCGYGRFLRLFSFYTNQIVGVDAWEDSLQHSRAAGFGDIVSKSDEVPNSLPVEGEFDFAFAFSVLTHLSERCALASLNSLRAVTAKGGVLVITIRPYEFWEVANKGSLPSRLEQVDRMKEEHKRSGFAFLPHLSGEPGEIHYGDTSMTLEWLSPRLSVSGWQIQSTDGSRNDPLQRYVFLKAV